MAADLDPEKRAKLGLDHGLWKGPHQHRHEHGETIHSHVHEHDIDNAHGHGHDAARAADWPPPD